MDDTDEDWTPQDWMRLILEHDLPRTTTRIEYKAISRWLRKCGTITEDYVLDALR